MDNILIVEDSETTRSLIKAVIEEMNDFNIIEAASGFEALKILPTERFSLIITDIKHA
jgi:two-component system chemotaxis response regulator CheY